MTKFFCGIGISLSFALLTWMSDAQFPSNTPPAIQVAAAIGMLALILLGGICLTFGFLIPLVNGSNKPRIDDKATRL